MPPDADPPRSPGAVSDGFALVTEDLDRHLAAIQRLLAAAEEVVGGPVVDESEQERLRSLAAGACRPATWRSALLRRHGEDVAYLGLVLPDGTRSRAITGDLALRRGRPDLAQVTAVALEAVPDLARGVQAVTAQVWLRAVGPAERAGIDAAGGTVTRELRILERPLPAVDPAGRDALAHLHAAGGRIRSFRPGEDDVEVVAILREAYAGTADGGWDHHRLAERLRYDWFDPEDLLVAEDGDGHLLGLHWLKHRGGREGEVYNLAVHPRAQGRRVGPALLQAGLDHLSGTGCEVVVLWVDAANERAVRLYERHGFTVRSTDVAVAIDLVA
ncbi:MAG: GNAT family N-acetyltransferase [Nitriliruptoraceae bacterium]